jgi:hypothetical protein
MNHDRDCGGNLRRRHRQGRARYNIVDESDVREALQKVGQYRATAAKQKVVAMS